MEISSPGIAVPEVNLNALSGGTVSLGAYRGQKRLVVFFMRAFNCMQCRDMVRKLATRAEILRGLDTDVIVVGPGARQEAERLARAVDTAGRMTILFDPTGDAYDHFSLDKTFFSLIQKSGVFIIDKRGIIARTLMTSNANQWLGDNAITEVVAAVEAVAGGDSLPA